VGDRYSRSSQYRYTLLHTTNGGTSWTNTGDSLTSGVNINGIWGSASNNVFAVGASGRIMRWNGSAWGTMTSGTTNTLYGVWGSASNNVFAVGASGTIRRWNGSAWNSMTSGTTQTLYGVWGTSASDVFALGANGTIRHYNGTSWSAMTSNSERNLFGAWGSSGSDVYAVGDSTGAASTILHYDGATWSAVTPGYPVYQWVDGHSGETVVASTEYRLGDNSPDPAPSSDWQWAYSAWSVLTLYSSPVTLAHQMYLYDTFRY
jgi:photosystem II stability/assembly factor-like uncharacterized protein